MIDISLCLHCNCMTRDLWKTNKKKIVKCCFCGTKGDWKTVLRNPEITMKDGSDIILCNDCINLYRNKDYETLLKRVWKKEND